MSADLASGVTWSCAVGGPPRHLIDVSDLLGSRRRLTVSYDMSVEGAAGDAAAGTRLLFSTVRVAAPERAAARIVPVTQDRGAGRAVVGRF
jgi:hypothetical protein